MEWHKSTLLLAFHNDIGKLSCAIYKAVLENRRILDDMNQRQKKEEDELLRENRRTPRKARRKKKELS
jgi:hypothetical protein